MLTYDLAHVQDVHTGMCACAIVICVRNVLMVRDYRKLEKKSTSLAYCFQDTNLQRNAVINCEPTPTYTCETHVKHPKWKQFLHM